MAFTFDQIATVLNTIVQDATGSASSMGTPRTTKDFVAAADTALSVGTDPIMHSISQLLARTIFSVRPYDPATALIDMDSLTYGNVVRKITPIFTGEAETQPMFDDQPSDGYSTDQYTVKRPKALETHFTGFSQWEVQAPTVFADQLRSAFRGPDELGQFLTSQMTAVQNEIASQKEALAHGTIANFIGGKYLRNSAQVRAVLTDYNNATGLSLTSTTVWQPANFEAFVKWLYAYIADISDLMTKRNRVFGEPITGYDILRHTPKRDQRLVMNSFILRAFKTMALSGIYHDDLLSMDNVAAPIEYWQSINYRQKISVNASYTKADGTVANDGVTQDGIIGILFDRDAMGCNVNLESVNTSPMNAKGRYYNTFYHMVRRYFNDLTEQAVVFVMA